jgi:hypothetical protein
MRLHGSGSVHAILHFLLHFKNVFKPQLLPIVHSKTPDPQYWESMKNLKVPLFKGDLGGSSRLLQTLKPLIQD